MIKKLDILIVRSFIGPFIVTFFVTLFVLVMQFFWLYMDELIGKGLSIWMIIQLLAFISTTLVPMALPLSILLASIMTFGALGENFELVAIKCAGISLLRFMRPLFYFILVIAIGAFLFNNNVIPVANLKALSLLYDLRNSKPALNIREGQFNGDITGFSIRVGSKSKDGRNIKNILIYDHSNGAGNEKIVLANAGEMFPSEDKQYLIFRLKDGWRYEESANKNGSQNMEQKRIYFKTWDKAFDLSGFKLNRTNEDLFKSAYQMMNVNQLSAGIDSMQRSHMRLTENVRGYIGPYLSYIAVDSEKKTLVALVHKQAEPVRKYDTSFIQLVKDSMRSRVMEFAAGHLRNAKNLMDVTSSDNTIQHENYIKFQIEWHRKFTLSFACILLFLIGAPLGAIIRKGGIGMPMVIAVGFFVVYYIISITGEKLASTGKMPPWAGMWMATSMLLPIAFILINQARNDSQIFTKEWYLRNWNKLRGLFPTTKK